MCEKLQYFDSVGFFRDICIISAKTLQWSSTFFFMSPFSLYTIVNHIEFYFTLFLKKDQNLKRAKRTSSLGDSGIKNKVTTCNAHGMRPERQKPINLNHFLMKIS